MKRSLLVLICMLLLQSCKTGVGNGSKPERLRFVNADLSTASTLKSYVCFSSQPILIAEFTDGSIGNFNSRSTFTSSDPTVIKVSNDDIEVPGHAGSFYSRGTLIAVDTTGTKTATITADFAGLKASVDVTANLVTDKDNNPPDAAHPPITVSNQRFMGSDDVPLNKTTAFMVPGSFQQMVAYTYFGGIPSAIPFAGDWSFVTPDDTQATINETNGLVSALAVPAAANPLRAQFTLPACSSPLIATPPPYAVTASTDADGDPNTITVKKPVKTILKKEPGYPEDRLIVGTSEYLRVLAQFSGATKPTADEQDLTLQGVTYAFDDPDNPPPVNTDKQKFVYLTLSALMQAIRPTVAANEAVPSAKAVSLTAIFGKGTTYELTPSDPLALDAVSATLKSVEISKNSAINPSTPCAASPTPCATIDPARDASTKFPATQQFYAVGHMCLNGADDTATGTACTGTNAFDQLINHDVSFGSSDFYVASISNSSLSAGLATVAFLADGTYAGKAPSTCTPTFNSADNITRSDVTTSPPCVTTTLETSLITAPSLLPPTLPQTAYSTTLPAAVLKVTPPP